MSNLGLFKRGGGPEDKMNPYARELKGTFPKLKRINLDVLNERLMEVEKQRDEFKSEPEAVSDKVACSDEIGEIDQVMTLNCKFNALKNLITIKGEINQSPDKEEEIIEKFLESNSLNRVLMNHMALQLLEIEP